MDFRYEMIRRWEIAADDLLANGIGRRRSPYSDGYRGGGTPRPAWKAWAVTDFERLHRLQDHVLNVDSWQALLDVQ